MSENEIIERALYDLLDSMGALSNPNEIDPSALGLTEEDAANILKAREIIRRRSPNGWQK